MHKKPSPLRMLRVAAGISQFDLARLLSLSRYRLQQIETGLIQPRFAERKALCAYFRLPEYRVFPDRAAADDPQLLAEISER